ncbi:hypothetical protein [Agromyces sp. Leaf222]|uniref:hypothetical protein n=1 Tax=Agromyces sp. Leaf222 TaxID=1735688 RepID=UPI000B309D40|nr:hypothetical protein [Agromyces sp. Leaf222]
MRRMLGRIAARTMPRTYRNLQVLSTLDLDDDTMVERIVAYETEVRELRAELNEVRRDNRRVTELYDLVFERLRDDMPLRATPLAFDGRRQAQGADAAAADAAPVAGASDSGVGTPDA